MHDFPEEYCGDGGRLLDIIKEMIEENKQAQKNFHNTSDYIEGRTCALRELAVELGIATYEDLLD